MNLITAQFHAPALGRHVTYSAILPVGDHWEKHDRFPVLYQLHGKSDDHTAWLNFSNLVLHAAKYPFIVILPDGAVSFWSDYSAREQYETFVMEDLWNHVARTLPVDNGKAAIGGLSMGGYGAMALGLKHPHRFASVWSHSSAFFDTQRFREFPAPPDNPNALDIFAIAEQAASAGTLPALGFDCGRDDFLIEENRRFHAHLDRLAVPHTYKEHEGAHTWSYWDEHVREALAHHYRVFKSSSRA